MQLHTQCCRGAARWRLSLLIVGTVVLEQCALPATAFVHLPPTVGSGRFPTSASPHALVFRRAVLRRVRLRIAPQPMVSGLCCQVGAHDTATADPAGGADAADAAAGGQTDKGTTQEAALEVPASIALHGKTLSAEYARELGPYDRAAADFGGRPVFRQRGGSSVIYHAEGCWVVGSEVGAMEGVSLLSQDDVPAPHLAFDWFEFGASGDILANPDFFVSALSASPTAQALELAAFRGASVTSVMKHAAPPPAASTPQPFIPRDFPHAPALDRLLDALTKRPRTDPKREGAARARAMRADEAAAANAALREALLGQYRALYAANRAFATDPRMPAEHAQVLARWRRLPALGTAGFSLRGSLTAAAECAYSRRRS
jgi:hypothetical protein